MSTIIQIKRSANVAAPTTSDLEEGELGYSYDKSNSGAGAKLYIEALNSSNSPVIHAIGGKYYTDLVDNATNNNTAGTLVKRDSNGDFSAGNITARLYGTSNVAVQLETARLINLSGDLEGNVSFNGTSDVTIVANIKPNSVALGTDTTGDYVSNVLAGTGIDIINQGGEGASPTISLEPSGVVADTFGGASAIPVITIDTYGRITSAANVTVSTLAFANIAVAGQSTVVADSSGDTVTFANAFGVVIETNATTDTVSFSLSNTGVVAATYGSATNIPIVAVDAQGRITSASNVAISTDLGISANVGTDTVSLASENLNVVGGTGITTSIASNTISIINTGVISVAGTTNEITVSAANGAVTIGMPDDVTIGGDLSVVGNLYVTGNVVSTGVENLIVEDSLIQLANNNISSDIIDIGFYGSYQVGGGDHEHAGFFRDASDSGKFKLFEGLQGQGNLTSTVNTSGTGFSIATLVANITGGTVSGLIANIAVSDGGTGLGTLTTNAVLYGQGTSAVGLATGTAGQVLQLNLSGVPVFGGLDGGGY